MSAMKELLSALIRIDAIIANDAPVARDTASATRSIVARSHVGQDSYGNWNATEAMRPFCIDVTARIRAEVEAEQCRIRDERLRVLSLELESLRAILPSLAARAAIEAGVQARALLAETQP